MGLKIEPDDGPPAEFLRGGSRLTFEEEPTELLKAALWRLRKSNKDKPARAKSRAITQVEDAVLWLDALERGEVR